MARLLLAATAVAAVLAVVVAQQHPCAALTCSGRGRCEEAAGCVCWAGYEGTNCERESAQAVTAVAAIAIVGGTGLPAPEPPIYLMPEYLRPNPGYPSGMWDYTIRDECRRVLESLQKFPWYASLYPSDYVQRCRTFPPSHLLASINYQGRSSPRLRNNLGYNPNAASGSMGRYGWTLAGMGGYDHTVSDECRWLFDSFVRYPWYRDIYPSVYVYDRCGVLPIFLI